MANPNKTIEENELSKQESLIHGGGPKIGRIHFGIEDLKRSKRANDWAAAYQTLEELWLEVEAYLTNQERQELPPLRKEFGAAVNQINKGVKVPGILGLCLVFEVRVRRVIARLHLDMEPKAKQKWLESTI